MTPYTPPPRGAPDLIHADASLLVADKPSGLLSVPGRGADKLDCLAARLQDDYPDALIVHRLDMETSGLIVLARGKEMHRRLSLSFQNRQVDKRYVALVDGLPAADAGSIDLPLIADWPNRPRQKVDRESGKPSLTHYRVLERDEEAGNARLELRPVTGRSHQLRVHLATLGHPILGDPLYAGERVRAKAGRLLLHAEYLSFAHPLSGETLRLRCPAPF